MIDIARMTFTSEEDFRSKRLAVFYYAYERTPSKEDFKRVALEMQARLDPKWLLYSGCKSAEALSEIWDYFHIITRLARGEDLT